MINIKINYVKLNQITKTLIDNLNSEMRNGDKLALFYIKIDNKKYYYSYDKIDYNFKDIYNSYKIVDYKKAQRLLNKQILSTL